MPKAMLNIAKGENWKLGLACFQTNVFLKINILLQTSSEFCFFANQDRIEEIYKK
jgi:hypothetical protein